MAVRTKGEKFFADFMLDGLRHRCFGFDSKIEAASWEASARLALAKGLPLPSGPVSDKRGAMTIEELVRHCAKVHWNNRGFKSPAKMVRNAELYAEFVGPKLSVADALKSEQVSDYVEHSKELERSGGTINRHLSSVSVMVRFAQDLGVLSKAPILPWQREGDGRFRYFEKAETEAIFKTLEDWSKHDELDFFRFLLDTGCRFGEALKADPKRDLTRTKSNSAPIMITFYDTKNGDSRTIPLTKAAHEALLRKGGFGHIDRWGIRSVWDRLRTKYEWMRDAVPHTFRHTCLSWFVQNGVDLYRVQKWAGHKTITTTMRYAKLSPDHLAGMVEIMETA